MATNKKRFFAGPLCGTVVEVENGIVKDVNTDQIYDDLTLEFLVKSDQWFEYDSLEEAHNQKPNNQKSN